MVGSAGTPALRALLEREAVVVAFDLGDHLEPVMKFMEKYADVPASLAHACLVRMTEMIDNPLLLSTDSDFRHFRRHARSVVPCGLPGR